MPKASPAPATPAKQPGLMKPAAAKPAPPPARKERPIIYPERMAKWFDSAPGGEGPITEEVGDKLLGWEDEEAYSARMGGTKEAPVKFPDNLITFTDQECKTVHCWNNNHNRPFDPNHALTLAQDELNRCWAGPITMPGETVNGESIIVTRTGEVDSGQHRLIGNKFANQLWRSESQKHIWQEKWPGPPCIESLVVFGISDDNRVTQTLDNVKPRTLADVLYTSDVFATAKSNAERKECSRMLDAAVDLLWKRTISESMTASSHIKYQTHSSSKEFLDRHPSLLKCVKHLFEENKDRRISALKLSAGQCAAMMYLMAASKTDGDSYRNAEPPAEKSCDMEMWDKASEFFVLLGSSPTFAAIKHKLMALVTPGADGLGGRVSEKLAVLSLAWEKFREGKPIKHVIETKGTTVVKDEGDLALEYNEERDRLLKPYDVGGIDLGESKIAEAGEMETPAQIKERLAAEEVAKLPKPEAAAVKNGKPSIMDVDPLKPGRAVPKQEGLTAAGREAQRAQQQPLTRKEIEAANTAKAKAADEAKAAAAAPAKPMTQQEKIKRDLAAKAKTTPRPGSQVK